LLDIIAPLSLRLSMATLPLTVKDSPTRNPKSP
jgi:hypothetical protein